eukprot:scaffold293931_cov30-Tisochrysis_lutea.AAC.1
MLTVCPGLTISAGPRIPAVPLPPYLDGAYADCGWPLSHASKERVWKVISRVDTWNERRIVCERGFAGM